MYKAQQLPLELPLETQFHSEDLVITNSNKGAFQLIEEWPLWTCSTAFLIGPKGSGKSHFASVWQKKSGAFIATNHTLEEAIQHAQKGRPILLENLRITADNEVAIFHLMNSVQQAHNLDQRSSLLFTTCSMPVHWEIALPDLRSRLRAVPLAFLYAPDDMLLRAVLTKLFADRQIQINDSLITYLITHMERSLSEAIALVERADRYALIHKTRITKNLLAQLLEKKEDRSK